VSRNDIPDDPTDRPRVASDDILPPGRYVVRLHANGESASIERIERPGQPMWVGRWAHAALLLQCLADRIDLPEPLTWEIRIP